MEKTPKKIVLAHDSFTQYGGAERVFNAIYELFPKAPVYTLVKSNSRQWLGQDAVYKTSFLNFFYQIIPRMQYWLLLIPLAVRSLKIPSDSLLISSSSGFVKNITVPKTTIHINYCHTPTRFLWIAEGYLKQELPLFLRPFKFLFQAYLNLLKTWDYKGAQRVDYFIANSREVQNRISQYYKKESVVIHPFVDIHFWKPTVPKQNYFLIAGRLHAHKNNELVIEAFNELGLPLHVVGVGRQKKYLESIAKSNIKFFGKVSDEGLRDQYSGAIGFLYPQLEDFGMMPLEAAACGTASIGLAKGGSLETILPGVTGELFHEPTIDSVKELVLNWDSKKYSSENLTKHAQSFSKEIFKQKLLDFIKNTGYEYHY